MSPQVVGQEYANQCLAI